MRITDLLDVLGVLAVAAFSFFIWYPAPLLVIGVALLVASFVRTKSGGSK